MFIFLLAKECMHLIIYSFKIQCFSISLYCMKRYLEFYNLNVGQHIQNSKQAPNKLGLTRCGRSDNPKYREDVMLYTRLHLLENLQILNRVHAARVKSHTYAELFYSRCFSKMYTFDIFACCENCVEAFLYWVWFNLKVVLKVNYFPFLF